VVKAFRSQLPQATIYVYDNNSTDRTIEVATAAGAICRSESKQGKGNVAGACSPTSRPMFTCWSMATTPTMRPACHG
jgi:hypothetical protein